MYAVLDNLTNFEIFEGKNKFQYISSSLFSIGRYVNAKKNFLLVKYEKKPKNNAA
jgi:hypothetical protein